MRTLLLLLFAAIAPPLAAQDARDAESAPDHVRACAACHGTSGVSVGAGIPNIAAQREGYLRSQLRAYRDGGRENALMNAVTAPLSDAGIDALAAYFAAQPGPQDGLVRSPLLPELVTPDFPFPQDYETRFTRYHTVYPGDQVRHYYANDVALEAAREGHALPDGSYVIVEIFAAQTDEDGEFVLDDDGRRIAAERVGFNVMAREAGWGDDVPELLRNEDWLYASFTPEFTVNTETNQANCLACHVPLDDSSYLFSLEHLEAAARGEHRAAR